MRHWTLAFAIILLLGILGAVGWLVFGQGDGREIYVFQGVKGPEAPSVVANPIPAKISDFETGEPNRLAILVTDPKSDWLGLVRVFKAHGVPVTVTTDPTRALRHQVVYAYPIISGSVLSPEAVRGLSAHVRNGGTLLAHDLSGGGLEEVFGIEGQSVSRDRHDLNWPAAGAPLERTIRVAGSGETTMPTLAYAPTTGEALARYEDGAAGVVCRRAGGKACLLGVDLGALATRTLNGRGEGIGRAYVNTYEPSLDVLVRWVRDLYVEGEPMPWLVDTAPAGREVSIVLTHDVDYGRSVPNAQAYGDLLAGQGVKATFFVQTKYIRDYNDEVFFDAASTPVMKRLVGQGMDVGSHSVAHARSFNTFPLGSGKERYPKYRPFVESRQAAKGASILGELRVSKFLLDRTGGADVISFRPGHLAYPFALPQALEATGYRYSSSLTANMAMSHLPFQLTYDRRGEALVPVYEFPVTIEDEKPPELGARFDAADAVVRDIARNRGVAVILIHPNITGHKLEFERRLVEAWRDRAWIGSLADFGGWWTARDRLRADVVAKDGGWVLSAGGSEAVQDLVILTPKARVKRTVLKAGAGEAVEVRLD